MRQRRSGARRIDPRHRRRVVDAQPARIPRPTPTVGGRSYNSHHALRHRGDLRFAGSRSQEQGAAASMTETRNEDPAKKAGTRKTATTKPEPPPMMTPEQGRLLHVLLRQQMILDREDVLDYLSTQLGREVASR